MKIKKFKLYKKFCNNILNDSKFAGSILKKHSSIKRWAIFQTPLVTKVSLLPISRYYGEGQLAKKRSLVFFDIRNKHNFNNYVHRFYSNTLLTIEIALLSAHFFKTSKEVSFIVHNRCVFLNGSLVISKRCFITEGDVLTFKKPLFKTITNLWHSSCFGTRYLHTSTFTKIPMFFEVSYSCPALVYCYSNLN